MDMTTIMPLAITEVNWPTFIKTVQDFLGYSPTRGLDESKIELKEPRAFLGSIDCENKPQEALRRAAINNTLRHYFASFIMIMDDADLVIHLGTQDHLAVRVKREGSRYLTILSGTMWGWYHAMITYCQRDAHFVLRQIFNTIYSFFKKAGLHTIWSHYDQNLIKDNTFVLEPK